MAWRTVELGEVANLVKRPVTPQPGTAYRQIGVRLWGQGAYERATVDGADTKYASLYEVREGDIIANKIWARNGSVFGRFVGIVGLFRFPGISRLRN